MQAAGLGERSGFAEPARGSAAQEAVMPGNVADWDADEDMTDDEGDAPEALGMPPQYTAAMAEQCAPAWPASAACVAMACATCM